MSGSAVLVWRPAGAAGRRCHGRSGRRSWQAVGSEAGFIDTRGGGVGWREGGQDMAVGEGRPSIGISVSAVVCVFLGCLGAGSGSRALGWTGTGTDWEAGQPCRVGGRSAIGPFVGLGKVQDWVGLYGCTVCTISCRCIEFECCGEKHTRPYVGCYARKYHSA